MLPVAFLQYADQLAQNNAVGPAEYRSAVSRAYYAAHHSARSFLQAVKILAPAGHGDVWNALLSAQDTDVRTAGSNLSNLHSDRRKADYELANRSQETQNAAVLAVRKATDIMAKLTTCLADALRKAAVEQDIKSWVGKIGGAGFTILP
jgi:uncharacterized protein (UPF0332 family)